MKNIGQFKAIIEQDENGDFIASVPAVPGCLSSGETFDAALENIKEALELCLEEAEENPDYKVQITYPAKAPEKRIYSIVDLPLVQLQHA